jgi:hypothetical protein
MVSRRSEWRGGRRVKIERKKIKEVGAWRLAVRARDAHGEVGGRRK